MLKFTCSLEERITHLRSLGKTYSEIEHDIVCSRATISYYCGKGQKVKNLTRSQIRRSACKNWLKEYKKGKVCKICGYDNPIALDFHHRNPQEKEWCISEMVAWFKKPEAMLKEIEKCDLICSNCHVILHYNEVNEGEHKVYAQVF